MRKVRMFLAGFGRFVFVLLVLISAFVFAMFQGGQVSWTIFYAILPFIIYSITLFLYPLSDITVKRTIRTRGIQRGGKLIVVINVKRKWRFPLLYTVVSERWNIEGQENFTKLFVFGFGKEMEWTYEVEKIPRGEHVIEGLRIEVSDFFGWIRKTRFIPIRNTVLVYPKTTDIHFVPMDMQYDEGTIISPFNMVKDTTLASGVRDYQAGDQVSWIHWKSFARTQKLMTKEFEDRRSEKLFVILDGRPSELFEEQVEFAASILKEAAKKQVTIGFLATGEERAVFTPIQTEEQFNQTFIQLAKIKPGESTSTVMNASYGRALQQGGSVLVITSNPDWRFIESVVKNVKNVHSIVCFAITKKDMSKQESFDQDIQFAKMKGIIVHTLTREQFSKVFKEVAHS